MPTPSTPLRTETLTPRDPTLLARPLSPYHPTLRDKACAKHLNSLLAEEPPTGLIEEQSNNEPA